MSLRKNSIIFKQSPWVLVSEQKNQNQTLSSEEMVRIKSIKNNQLSEEQRIHKAMRTMFSEKKSKLEGGLGES